MHFESVPFFRRMTRKLIRTAECSFLVFCFDKWTMGVFGFSCEKDHDVCV